MAEQELNGKQLLFVAEYIKTNNATQAAINAGYSQKTAYSQGQRLLKNAEIQKHVQAAQTDIYAMLAKESVDSIQTIKHLRDFSDNDSVRLKAAQDLLDRAGYKSKDKVEMDMNAQVVFVDDLDE